MLRITKLYNSVIFYFTKKHISYSSLQLLCYNIKSSNSTNYLNIVKNDNNISIFSEYLQKNINPAYRQKIMQHYLKLSINNNNPFLINEKVSNHFATLIKDDLLLNMSYVVELNPGYGLLTKDLLEAGIEHIHLYENRSIFYSELYNLQKIFPNRIIITETNFLKISKLLYIPDKLKYFNQLFNNVSKRKWEEQSYMQIIGTLVNSQFIRHIILSTIFQTGFMINGRIIFYFAISPTIWNKLIYQGSGSLITYVMFNILFNYTIFGTLDRKGFLPWQKRKRLKKYKKIETDNNFFYVVKFEPKPDIFTLFGEKEHIINFWHFIRQNLYKPSTKIIPTLEKIVPGCGIRLIKDKNYNIFTEFQQLSISEIFDLYMDFKSWPEFKQSSFLSSANDVRISFDPYAND